MDIEALFTIVCLAVMFWIGYIYREVQFYKELHAIKLNFQNTADEIYKPKHGIKEIKFLKHEIVDGIHYFYGADDGVFAGQGATLEDAAKHFNVNHGKNKMGYFEHTIHGKRYYFVDCQCVEVTD